MSRSGRRWMLPALLLLGVLLPREARGQVPRKDPAVESYDRGLELFQRGRYVEAMRSFSRGYGLSHRPGFLFNMAECARLMADKARARELYLRYLALHPTGKLRPAAQRRCDELGRGTCVPGAAVSPTAPAPEPVVEPLVPAPVSAAPPDVPTRPRHRPFYKHWAFWTAVGVGVTAATIGIAAGASRSGGKPAADLTVDMRALGVVRW